MELKLDKTTKVLLGAIALGLFLNASNVFIDKAFAESSFIHSSTTAANPIHIECVRGCK